jgi:hypothetical protein
VASVGNGLGREVCSFSAAAGEMVHGAGISVHGGAGRGCRGLDVVHVRVLTGLGGV